MDAAVKVLESLSSHGRSVEIDPPEILKQIGIQKLKTVKGSIDERDSLRRSLEQTVETFYASDNDKFGLVKFKPKSEPPQRPKVKEKRGRPPNVDRAHNRASADHSQTKSETEFLTAKRPLGKKKKSDSQELRQRKISTEDLFAPESPLIGINLKDYINEETFSQLGVHHQVKLEPMIHLRTSIRLGKNFGSWL